MRQPHRVIELIDDQTWRTQAACVDARTGLFFAEDEPQIDAAKRICARCPVSEDCLSFALLNRVDDGIWGGFTEKERRRMLKQQRETAA